VKVLVTGGAGFIGSHVVDRLLASGYEASVFDLTRPRYHDRAVEYQIGDVLDRAAVGAALRGCDAVIHLAAVADVNTVVADPLHAGRVNVLGTQVVLEAARNAGVSRFLFGSTIWVYGNGASDQAVTEGAPLSPPSHPYTAMKIAGEMYCHAYRELFDLDAITLRFGIPHGPRSREAAVVAAFVARARAGKALTITGTGRQSRQFVYVEDLADGVVAALSPRLPNRVYNLVGDESTTVLAVANTVRDLVGDVPIVHTGDRLADLQIGRISAERADRELGWRATTPFRRGVRRYLDWLTDTNGSPVRAAASTISGRAETILRQEAGEL
jgi:UDP-glucose 4-epimerase